MKFFSFFLPFLIIILLLLLCNSYLYSQGSPAVQTGLIYKKTGAWGLSLESQASRLSSSKSLKVLEDYPNYVLAEFSLPTKESLEQAGNRIELLQGRDKISLDTYVIDILKGQPDIPLELKIEDYEIGTNGYYFVKFIGPIKDEWLKALKDKGAEPLQYYPHFAYLVKMKSEKRKEIEAINNVNWVGVYQPAYKMSKELKEGLTEGKKFNSQQLNILIIKDSEKIPEIIKEIESFGGIFEQKYDLDFYTKCRVRIDFSKVPAIVKIPDVYWVDVYYKPEKEDEVSDEIIAGNYTAGVPSTGYSSWLSSMGINGNGVTVGIVDDGVDDTHPDLNGRVVSLDYGDGSLPEGHGHHVAGIVAGNGSIGTVDGNGFLYGLGVAPNANIIDQPWLKAFATATYQELVRDCVKTNGPNGQPGYIQNNSWGSGPGNPPGTNTTYESTEREYDIYARDADDTTAGNQSLIICFSAGNDGDKFSPGSNYQTLTRPKAAKNVFVTGATNNYRPLKGSDANNIDQLATFSSRGPAADGRIRPEFCTPGTWIASLRGGLNDLWGNIDLNYRWCSGTSQASPHTAGASALIVQWYKNQFAQTPSPAMVKAMLVNSTVDMNSAGDNDYEKTTSPIPNNDEGWGRINLKNIFDTSVSKVFRDNPKVFHYNSELYSLTISPGSVSKPLKITLVWTDAPGAPGANPALVNNLNLVITQGGMTYYGNNFTNGWSVAGGSPDNMNNVESVYIQNPSGTYKIDVIASILNGDGIPGNSDLTDQDFALVISNALIQTSDGTISMDSLIYTCPDTIQFHLFDSDLHGLGPQSITIKSSTETTPEPVSLTESGMPGLFTGSINTDSGTPATDGKLQVSHNDLITATYIDLNDGKGGTNVTKTVTATADSQGPIIYGVNVPIITNNSATIIWNTDEISNSVVNYGTSSGSLSNSESDAGLVTAHSINLAGLTQCTPYYFEVRSADGWGNETVDNRGNAYYFFVTWKKMYSYFFDDLEPTEETGWLHYAGQGTDSWALSTDYSNSPTHSWHSNDEGSITDDYLITPSIAIGSNARLSFYHTYQLEEGYDGAVIEISTTGSSGIFDDLGSYILQGEYDMIISSSWSSPIGGRMAWTGGSLGAMTPVVVNLNSFAGNTINIRFRMASDESYEGLGWYVDDVEFYFIVPCSTGIEKIWELY